MASTEPVGSDIPGSAASRPPARRLPAPWAGLAALLVVAALLRVVAILTVGDIARPHGDEGWYLGAAASLARGEGYPGSARPPAFPAYLALVRRALGDSLIAARLGQVPIALLSVALVFDLVRRRFGDRAALLSGLLCALNPTLVFYTHFLWSETFVSATLLLFLWCIGRFDEGGDRRWLIAAGLALALAVLARELLVYVAPLTAAWLWVWREREPSVAARAPARAARLAAFLLPLACGVLPWTARNYAVQGRFVLVSTTRWPPVAIGNLAVDQPRQVEKERIREFRRAQGRLHDELQREDFARGVALRMIAEQQPWWILYKIQRNVPRLFAPTGQLERFADLGWLDPGMSGIARRLTRVEVGFFAGFLALGLLALWLVPDRPLKSLVVAILLLHVGLYTVTFATDRYRVPLLPLFGLYIGPLLCGRVALDRSRRWRVAGAAVSLLAFAAALATAKVAWRDDALLRARERPGAARHRSPRADLPEDLP